MSMLNDSGELLKIFKHQELESEPRSPSVGLFMAHSTGSILVRSTRLLEDVAVQNLSESILMHLYGMETSDGERWCNLIARSGRPGDMSVVFGANLAEKYNGKVSCIIVCSNYMYCNEQ